MSSECKNLRFIYLDFFAGINWICRGENCHIPVIWTFIYIKPNQVLVNIAIFYDINFNLLAGILE